MPLQLRLGRVNFAALAHIILFAGLFVQVHAVAMLNQVGVPPESLATVSALQGSRSGVHSHVLDQLLANHKALGAKSANVVLDIQMSLQMNRKVDPIVKRFAARHTLCWVDS